MKEQLTSHQNQRDRDQDLLSQQNARIAKLEEINASLLRDLTAKEEVQHQFETHRIQAKSQLSHLKVLLDASPNNGGGRDSRLASPQRAYTYSDNPDALF